MLNFQDLYEAYATDVYRFAFWPAGDSSKAEDITSETFIRAWVKRSTIRTETSKPIFSRLPATPSWNG